MRDVFGVHARRVQRALESDLASGDAVHAFARDEVERVYWVITNRELIVLETGESGIRTRIPLDAAIGQISSSPLGFSARVSSRGGGIPTLIGTFRTANGVTRVLAERLTGEPNPEPNR